jgi:polysaccharide deacetylase 2 family uncharacterized protein YibQ
LCRRLRKERNAAMADDELTRPLGLREERPRRIRRPLLLAIGCVAVLGVVGLGRYLATEIKPTTIAEADKPTVKPAPKPKVFPPGSPGLIEAEPSGAITELGSGEVVITDPWARPTVRLAAAPVEDLLEDGEHGLLPRIAPDGTRPMDAYARPSEPPSGSMSRVAIVVGGVGIARDGSNRAIEDLPGEVTLAFAPYSEDLPKLLARARDAGHEVLLQVPLEPYGYPDNDPGPHTLTIDAAADENIDRLHWLMSRLTTYVGVTNYLGARFTSDEEALEPVIVEVGERGLLYFDDGSSGASKADRLAKGATPFIRADAVIDADTSAKAIDARLAEIESLAKRRGYAIASASAFPVSIERIADFARDAADRGIEIVPLTALVPPDRP